LTPIPDDPFSRRRDHSNDRYADAEPEVSDDSSITEPVDAGNDNDKTRTRLPIRRDSLRAVPSYYWVCGTVSQHLVSPPLPSTSYYPRKAGIRCTKCSC
jgi:hypothetical protein